MKQGLCRVSKKGDLILYLCAVSRIMAIDYGRKRVGLAVTDSLGLFATALATVPEKELFDYLRDYLVKEQVSRFVVGEPRKLDNTPSATHAAAEKLVRKLQQRYPEIPISRVDERFSSTLAQQSLRDAGMSRRMREDKGLVDSVAAVLLLQTYLAHPGL